MASDSFSDVPSTASAIAFATPRIIVLNASTCSGRLRLDQRDGLADPVERQLAGLVGAVVGVRVLLSRLVLGQCLDELVVAALEHRQELRPTGGLLEALPQARPVRGADVTRPR